MKVIDVHCHIVPADFPAAPSTCAPEKWPRMEDRTNGQRAMMVGSREMRVVDNRAWEAARRIADMNGEDVGMQAISPMPEILSYWLDAQSAAAMAHHMNRTIAEIVHAAPDRFVGLGMVPLQDPALAAKELATLRSDLVSRRRDRQQHQRQIAGRSVLRSVLRRGRAARTSRSSSMRCIRR